MGRPLDDHPYGPLLLSADNGVYILRTTSRFRKQTGRGGMDMYENQFTDIPVWRVAHLQAIDGLSWYEEHQPYNVGAFLHQSWGKCEPFYDEDSVKLEAARIASEISYLEYGIATIDRRDLTLFGD